jgi:hypothetical protein
MNSGIADLGISTPRSPASSGARPELAQRIGLAYVVVGCLSYLAASTHGAPSPWFGNGAEALAIADAHGWSTA